MKRTTANCLSILLLLSFTVTLLSLKYDHKIDDAANAGLTTPNGFTAIKLIEGVGRVRHLIVTSKGNIYARLASPVNGQGTLLLQENGGKAVVKSGFGNYGGTGIRLYKGYLYVA